MFLAFCAFCLHRPGCKETNCGRFMRPIESVKTWRRCFTYLELFGKLWEWLMRRLECTSGYHASFFITIVDLFLRKTGRGFMMSPFAYCRDQMLLHYFLLALHYFEWNSPLGGLFRGRYQVRVQKRPLVWPIAPYVLRSIL